MIVPPGPCTSGTYSGGLTAWDCVRSAVTATNAGGSARSVLISWIGGADFARSIQESRYPEAARPTLMPTKDADLGMRTSAALATSSPMMVGRGCDTWSDGVA